MLETQFPPTILYVPTLSTYPQFPPKADEQCDFVLNLLRHYSLGNRD
jgi:hypothetical protein